MKLFNTTNPQANLRIGLQASSTIFLLCLFSLFALPSVAYAQDNPTRLENLKEGTRDWKLSNSADDINLQIKGYASATSVNQGDNITFYVTTNPAQQFDIEIYRVGWYNGNGGRLMTQIRSLNGQSQAVPVPEASTGLLELDWNPSHTLRIPTDWTSGVYLAKLTNASGFDNYIIFVVRDDNRVADFLYQQPVTTYQAYNNFPNNGTTGKSHYTYNSFGPNTISGNTRAVKISFDRPYAKNGIGDFLRWEYDLVLWMERVGYDVTYSTNIDTHRNGADLLNHEVFLSVGHDEYWTREMYDAAENARDSGIHLAFMGANAVYGQVRLEESSNNIADRVVVSYNDPSIDPETNPAWKSDTFRRVGRPEQLLRGVTFANFNAGNNTDYIVKNSEHWVYDQTGLANGDRILEIIGYEVDIYYAPLGLPPHRTSTILAESPFKAKNGDDLLAATMIFQSTSNAWVFSSGTMSWSNALNSYWDEDSRLQQMTANLFQRFINSNNAPVITNPGHQDSFENQTISLQISASDPNGLPLTYEAVNLPRGLSINPNTGLISGRFDPNRIRDTNVSITVRNGIESSSIFFTWQVNRANAGACHSGGQEAEWGKLFGNFEMGEGENASGGEFVRILQGADTLTFNPYDRVEYCFTVPTAGNYRVKAWVKAPDEDSNSFYVTMDGGPAQPYIWTAKQGNSFQTDYLNSSQGDDPLVFNLSVGNHTLAFHQHEGNIGLDRLELELVSGDNPSPPDAVSQIAPNGSISNSSPTFQWSKTDATTAYRLLIRNTDTGVLALNETYELNQLTCDNSTCLVDPPGLNLPSANYKWNIQAKSNDVPGPWSRNMNFSVVSANLPEQIAPQGTITDASPTVSWSKIGGATAYRILIRNTDTDELALNETYQLNQLTCDNSTCSVDPPGLNLPSANYKWNIQAKSNDVPGPWSRNMNFSVVSENPPEQLAPQGTITDASPTVSWSKIGGATAYKLLIRNTDTDELALNETYQLNQLACDNSTCSVDPPGLNLPSANYKWNIQAKSNDIPGPWSRNMNFSVVSESSPQQMAPQGSITDGTPNIKWGKVGGASSYKLVIHNADTDELLLNQTYTINQLTCDNTSCSITPPGFAVSFGNYEWNIQAKSNDAAGPWSGTMDFSIVPLSSPQQIGPQGPIPDSSPTISWAEVSGAIAYKVLVRNTDTDVLMLNQVYSLDQLTCNGGTCSIRPSGLSLSPGNYKWNILAENYNGPGLWSPNMRFSVSAVNASANRSEAEAVPDDEPQEFSTYISAYWN